MHLKLRARGQKLLQIRLRAGENHVSHYCAG
jgi:hypothetical protein